MDIAKRMTRSTLQADMDSETVHLPWPGQLDVALVECNLFFPTCPALIHLFCGTVTYLVTLLPLSTGHWYTHDLLGPSLSHVGCGHSTWLLASGLPP